MAKGKVMPVKASVAERKNGKKFKKNPGPARMEKTNFTHVKGRTLKSHEKREAWKAAGGVYKHTSIPHWKTGLIWDKGSLTFITKEAFNRKNSNEKESV